MRRPVLVSTFVFGMAMSLAAFSGVFAVFSDQASTGENTFETAELPKAVDLKLAEHPNPGTCQQFTDDLETAFFTVADATPSPAATFTGYWCLQNFGSLPATATFSAVDVSDTELDCTGDEEAAGDTTCTPQGAGEISDHLLINLPHTPCTGGGADDHQGTLSSLQNTPVSIGVLQPGECRLLIPNWTYNPTGTAALMGQSDAASFRLVFNGESAP